MTPATPATIVALPRAFAEVTPPGVNITIGWDGRAGRATLHDTGDADTFRCTQVARTAHVRTVGKTKRGVNEPGDKRVGGHMCPGGEWGAARRAGAGEGGPKAGRRNGFDRKCAGGWN